MKIASLGYRVPSRKLSNDDLIDHIEAQNREVPWCKKKPYLKLVRKLLARTGAETRHWRDIAAGEKACDLILGAMGDALEQACMTSSDVDLLIYCGVGKGFLEPANAYFYARAKGMYRANCFDITDACMSWVRAIQTAYLMLRSGAVKTVMVINGECHLGLHDNWAIRDFRALEYTFPMYTIGEAATATVLVASEDDWQFDYSSRPEFVDLCTIPLPGHTEFTEPSDKIGLNGINRFASFGRELFREAESILGELMLNTLQDPAAKTWYFPPRAVEGRLRRGHAEIRRSSGESVFTGVSAFR